MITCPFCLSEINPRATACPHCRRPFDDVTQRRFAAEAKRQPARPWLTDRFALWLIAGLVIAGLWVVLAPGGYHGPEPSRRSSSKNNLKQIGLAFLNYHDTHTTFPPGSVVDESGRAHHGWQAMLLPFLESSTTYSQIDFNKPWDDPANAAPFQRRYPTFLIPGVKQTTLPSGYWLSHYSGNSHVLFENSSVKISDVTDGTSHTLLAGEVVTEFKAWGDPGNTRDPALGINTHPQGFGSPFKDGAHILLMDGSVRFLSETMEPHVLHALATPAGGETVPDF